MEQIPAVLHDFKQWTISFSKRQLKRPKHTKYKPNGAFSLEAARREAGKDLLTGLYVTDKDPYILGDIDHIKNPHNPFPELPEALVDFLQSVPTYAEVSPSGHGIRFLLQLPSAEDKAKLEGNIFYLREVEDKRSVQINFGPPWMTITGNSVPWAEPMVAEVSLEQLDTLFQLKWATKKQEDLKVKRRPRSGDKLPQLSEISQHLLALSLSQDPRIQRAFRKTFNAKYEHYDYWLKVLMALHDYAERAGKLVECLDLAIKWSMKDHVAFESEQDVQDKWTSFKTATDRISYKTLFRLSYHYHLRWPMIKKPSKEEKERNAPLKPIITEYVNFKALVDHYDIKLVRDVHNDNVIYLTADPDVAEEFFQLHGIRCFYGKYYGLFTDKSLWSCFHILLQRFGFIGISHTQVKMFVSNYLVETTHTVDIIKLFFDTKWEELPEEYRENEVNYDQSTVTEMFKALDLDFMTGDHHKEGRLYYRYYEAWLMGIVRNLWYPESLHMNNCILLLTGPEQIRKTSHFRFMLPSFMRQWVAFTPHGFSDEGQVRDTVKLSSNNLLIVWDEIEQHLNARTESNFKKVLDNIPQKLIDKYEVLEKTFRPMSIYGATSNLREFKLGQEGSRRIFHIPVKWVDTDRLSKINWHSLINRLRRKVKRHLRDGNVPWLLGENELRYQQHLHTGLRAKTNLDLALNEVFNFDKDITHHLSRGSLPHVGSLQKKHQQHLLTLRQVSDYLTAFATDVSGMKNTTLTKTLERMCGDYTGTRRRAVDCKAPKCTVFKGLASQGPYKKWVMPPIREEVAGERWKKVDT